MEYKKYKANGYNIYTIKTDKFKNCHLEVIFRNNCLKEEITKRAIICDLLMRSSKKYPTRTDVEIELENLYNTHIYGIMTRVGNSIFTNYCLDFINPKYAEKNLSKKTIELLFEMLLNPNIENDNWNKDSFNIIKNNLKADILAAKENALGYAMRRMLFHMDETSPISFSTNGYLSDLEKITPENIIPFYIETMTKDACDIFIIGDLDMEKIVNDIKKVFQRTSSKNKITLYAKNRKATKIKEIKEKENYNQASLLVGCNVHNLTERERNYVSHIFNVIMGEGSLETKLHKSLRTDNSLCYQTKSLYQKFDNVIILYAGIDPSNYKRCVKLIKKALDEMVSGNITDEEIENAKLLIKSSLVMTFDNPAGLINNFVFEVLDGLPRLDERINEISTVTKDEIIAFSKKLAINTIYMLSNEGES